MSQILAQEGKRKNSFEEHQRPKVVKLMRTGSVAYSNIYPGGVLLAGGKSSGLVTDLKSSSKKQAGLSCAAVVRAQPVRPTSENYVSVPEDCFPGQGTDLSPDSTDPNPFSMTRDIRNRTSNPIRADPRLKSGRVYGKGVKPPNRKSQWLGRRPNHAAILGHLILVASAKNSCSSLAADDPNYHLYVPKVTHVDFLGEGSDSAGDLPRRSFDQKLQVYHAVPRTS